MRDSLIKDLLYGGEGICDNLKPTATHYKIGDKIDELENKLAKSLNKEQNKILDELIELKFDWIGESSEYHFVEGFKFGVKLGLECMQENSDDKN